MTLIPRPAPLQIDPQDPFSADSFSLSDFAAALTSLVESTTESFVVNLDAPWGQGKTTFLGMWRHALASNDVKSLYFNAWETDFTSDPLIALIGELGSGIEELKAAGSTTLGKNLARLKKLGAQVAMRSLPAVVKLATMGVLDAKDIEALTEAGEKFAEEEIRKFEKLKNSMKEFRNELQSLAASLAVESKPLVIVIDELDRCRPDYAIKVLETVKHLFTVPGVFFLIATDARQLANAIRHVYGLDAAADDYLRRFFDLSLSLPTPSAKQFVAAQMARYGLDTFFQNRNHPELRYDRDQLVSALTSLFVATNCSLRDQEKCFTLLVVSMKSVEQTTYLHPLLLCVLIVLRVKRLALYEKFMSGEIDARDIVANLSETREGKRFFQSDRGYGAVVFAYLIFATQDKAKRDEILADLSRLKSREQDDSEERTQAMRVLEVMHDYQFRNSRNALRLLQPRIELFSRQIDEEYF